MKRTYISLALIIVCSIIFGCKNDKSVNPEIEVPGPEQKIDLDKAAVMLMDTLTHNLLGRWNFTQVEYDVKYQPATGSVTRDTTFHNFALLDIYAVTREGSPRYPLVKGQVHFKDNTYPIQFQLFSDPTRLIHKKGPQATTLIEYIFPTGGHVWKDGEIFFRDSGIIGENYSIEFDRNSRQMVWKGLNGDVKQIIMKQL